MAAASTVPVRRFVPGRKPLTIEAIVGAGLCIGCGLCESVCGREAVEMVLTPDGRERPRVRRSLDAATIRKVNQVCPGTRVEGPPPIAGVLLDPVWGPIATCARVHATDPEVRFRAASGGALSALAGFLLDSGRVERVLHVAASTDAPLRTDPRVSATAEAALDACGSRYGPAAPLREIEALLAAGRPFALVAKPCDVSAVRNLARVDPRVAVHLRYTLTMVCGGASELGKSRAVLDRFGVSEEDVALFRYRGHGCPGATTIVTRDGRTVTLGYTEMWEDETTWQLQARCKICPDAIGEAADVVAGDTWPEATPEGEDAGFNSLTARTAAGRELVEAAVAAGVLTRRETLTPRDLDRFNPHQVAKKRAVAVRLAALRASGRSVPRVRRLRVARLALAAGPRAALAEAAGSFTRIRAGRLGHEPPVTAAEEGTE